MSSLASFLDIKNLDIVQSAVTNEISNVFLTPPEHGFGGWYDALIHIDQSPGSVGLQVPTTTVDREVRLRELPFVDFIKCDVEGAEWMVFDGARRTLSEHRPIVLCEIEDRWARRFGHTRGEVIEMVRGLGHYDALVYENDRMVPLENALRPHQNVLFLPMDSQNAIEDAERP